MNKSSTKPILALAILSFLLTLSSYGRVNSSIPDPQTSIKNGTVEQSLQIQSQFDSSKSNQTTSVTTIIGVGIVVGILSLIKGKNSSKHSSTAPHSSSRSKRQVGTVRLEQASRELQNKLLSLLHGDRGAASRLLSQVKMKNPDRSINWHVEKVIYDLQRDHGRW